MLIIGRDFHSGFQLTLPENSLFSSLRKSMPRADESRSTVAAFDSGIEQFRHRICVEECK